MGPIASIDSLIMILVGALVSYHALGPWGVNKYVDSNNTKNLDKDDMHPLGEAMEAWVMGLLIRPFSLIKMTVTWKRQVRNAR